MDTNMTQDMIHWVKACALFDKADFSTALLEFHTALEYVPTAKLNFNIAQCHLNQGRLEDAIGALTVALQQDSFLAVAYFQRGVCYYQLCEWQRAVKDFGLCVQSLRGNMVIDYAQLGLAYRLYACEPTYNLAMANFCLRNTALALTTLSNAERLLPLLDRPREYYANVDKALKLGQGCESELDLYMCPLRCIYRPLKSRVEIDRKSVNSTLSSTQFNGSGNVSSSKTTSVSQSVSKSSTQFATQSAIQSATQSTTQSTSLAISKDKSMTLSQEIKMEYQRRNPDVSMDSLAPLQMAVQVLQETQQQFKNDKVEKVIPVMQEVKLRVKLHHLTTNDIRSLTITLPTTYSLFSQAIYKKMNANVVIKWKDEDDELMVVGDDDDLRFCLSNCGEKVDFWVV